MSTDHGPGAPSFGDLFEDPDYPVAAARTPEVPTKHAVDRTVDQPVGAAEDAPPQVAPQPATAEPPVAEPVAVRPVISQPVAADTVTAADAADRAAHAHALDHESAEASHLVAGFEAVDEDPEPAHAAPLVAVAAVTVAAAEPVSVAPVAQPWDGTVDPAISSAPAGRVDTGRLYRSAGAEGPATLDAIPAIDPSYSPGRRVEVVSEPTSRTASADRGLTYSGVVVVVGSVTVLVAFAEAILRQQVGVATGVALLVSSVYAALVVRRADIWAAVVVPPLAFLAAALTAGQLTLDKSGSLLIREGFSVFRTLATNAPWILGTTAICLLIVLVRRRRP